MNLSTLDSALIIFYFRLSLKQCYTLKERQPYNLYQLNIYYSTL